MFDGKIKVFLTKKWTNDKVSLIYLAVYLFIYRKTNVSTSSHNWFGHHFNEETTFGCKITTFEAWKSFAKNFTVSKDLALDLISQSMPMKIQCTYWYGSDPIPYLIRNFQNMMQFIFGLNQTRIRCLIKSEIQPKLSKHDPAGI